MILKAVVKDGKLHPLDPLGAEWMEGRTVKLSGEVDLTDDGGGLQRWYEDLERLVAKDPLTPEDFKELEEALEVANHRSAAGTAIRQCLPSLTLPGPGLVSGGHHARRASLADESDHPDHR